ncbi:hypothetical protein niasHT_014119 [Heterodera trifolii]|uniref:Uncharacterized protein n=1 Tax=Heterodera trifolii TaxID=157864 RepID=A0ABD2LGD5_9BILA
MVANPFGALQLARMSGRAFDVAISALPCIIISINNNNEERALALLRNVLSSLGDLQIFNHFAVFIDSVDNIRQAVELLEQGNAAESAGRIETAQNLLEGLQQNLRAILVAVQQQPQQP